MYTKLYEIKSEIGLELLKRYKETGMAYTFRTYLIEGKCYVFYFKPMSLGDEFVDYMTVDEDGEIIIERVTRKEYNFFIKALERTKEEGNKND